MSELNELNDLYREVILDHARHPRNKGALPSADRKAEGYNPLCGDRVILTVKLDSGVIADVRFEGSGCAISTASASILTETLKGKTEAEFSGLFDKFHTLVTSGGEAPATASEWGKLAVFEGVREFPMRVKCATLSWHTLKAALENKQEPVTTEE
ncbi:MAG: SUF system NifU family Fe-S cluster assembly protein [Deltaproteobacteria bacterium]|nr:SUF system NifU family Fe-S cluster assembly protein [Deltaproteobacteria bacterium]